MTSGIQSFDRSTVAAIGLTEIGNAPLVLDTDLGERLGMDRPTNIRQSIEKNRAELEAFGPLHVANAMVQIGSGAHREVTAFFLTEEQALLVCSLSRAPRAKAVRSMLIRVFVAWRHGRLKPAESDRLTAEQVGDLVATAVHRELAMLLPALVEAAIAADSRRAVLDYVSVRQLLDEAKALPKGRNRVNRRIGHELRDRALIETPPAALRRCAHSGVWLFPRDFALIYMAERGNALVREHNDRTVGQGVFRLVKPQSVERRPTP